MCLCQYLKTCFLPGLSDEVRPFGSVDYWLRLRIPMTETLRLYTEKLKAVGSINTALNEEAQVQVTNSHFSEKSALISVPSKKSSNI